MNEDLIHQRFNVAKQLGCNFAAMRLPNSNDAYYFYASEVPKMSRVQHQEALDRPLFFCSPYSAGDKAYTLVSDAVFKNNTCIFGNLPEAVVSKNTLLDEEVNKNFIADEAFYLNYVNNIVTNIGADKFDKVVAARCEELTTNQEIDVTTLFIDATNNYPNAAVYFFSINGVGSWLGATPEKLLSVTNNNIETVAMAGTMPANQDIAWTEKEQDEQGMIEFFINDVLKQQGIKKIEIGEVETITAGSVSHLRSVFKAKIPTPILQAKLHKIIGNLNPTPAVCGLPQFEASLFIAENEKMERRFYSGFIGMQWPSNNMELFVNIRCCQLFTNTALLYTGAGITAGSNAQKEWQETQGKLNTIKSLFNN